METHNIDSKIRKAINESVDFYDLEAANSKEKIWQQVQLKKQNQPKLYLLRTLAAACILLFVATFIITISNIKADRKIKTLVELNSSLQNQINKHKENTSTQKKLMAVTNIVAPDTVYIEKTVSVLKPVIKTEQIVDTVYIERKVFVEKEIPQKLIAESDNGSPAETPSRLSANSYETRILIRNNENLEQKKERKLQIKFGGNKNQSNEGSLALVTEL
ncbi:MAG: hypothetical protein EOM76_05225 [Sphingobacteriia bacterium]|nr:hypothetical protein [Sphingobacteriia bacterium]